MKAHNTYRSAVDIACFITDQMHGKKAAHRLWDELQEGEPEDHGCDAEMMADMLRKGGVECRAYNVRPQQLMRLMAEGFAQMRASAILLEGWAGAHTRRWGAATDSVGDEVGFCASLGPDERPDYPRDVSKALTGSGVILKEPSPHARKLVVQIARLDPDE